MFGVPERRVSPTGDVHYFVPLHTPLPIGGTFECTDGKTVVPNHSHQPKFEKVQRAVLSELTKNPQLFKNPPTMESLEAITPNWGCILKEKEYVWNPYTIISTNNLLDSQTKGSVDMSLEGITLSRSTITPQFRATYVEEERIEFDWNTNPNTNLPELEEVSDLAFAEGSLELRDPVLRDQQKKDAKERIRSALRDAHAAKLEAIQMANEFLHTFDVSDNESTFTEWIQEVSEDESV